MFGTLGVTFYQQKNVSWQVTFKTNSLTLVASHLLDILAPNLLLFVLLVSPYIFNFFNCH
jgi:hypothetical protein